MSSVNSRDVQMLVKYARTIEDPSLINMLDFQKEINLKLETESIFNSIKKMLGLKEIDLTSKINDFRCYQAAIHKIK